MGQVYYRGGGIYGLSRTCLRDIRASVHCDGVLSIRVGDISVTRKFSNSCRHLNKTPFLGVVFDIQRNMRRRAFKVQVRHNKIYIERKRP